MRHEIEANQTDVWAVVHEAIRRKLPLSAQVGAVTYTESDPAWLLTFSDLPGIRGICPGSETGLGDPRLLRAFAGQTVYVVPVGADETAGIVACSRLRALAQAQERLAATVKPGSRLDAVVRAVLPAGGGQPSRLVVDLGGGVLAELPRRHVARRLAVPLAEQYRVGDVVPVMVETVGPVVQVRAVPGPDPWLRIPPLPRGARLTGTVVLVADGAKRYVLVEPDIAPGCAGLAGWPVRGVLRRGDRVEAVVTVCDPGAQKLHMRIRRVLK